VIGKIAVCVATVLCLFTLANSQDKPLAPLPEGVKNVGDPAKIKAVLAREDDLLNAYRKLDAKLVADLYAEDYLTLKMGTLCCVGTKDDQINSLIEHRDAKVPYPITSMNNEQVVVRVHGDTAVVTGVQKISVVYQESPPRPASFKILFMDVWSLEHGKWLLIGGSHKIVN
jgi:ketosteroid isomerase-like protein